MAMKAALMSLLDTALEAGMTVSERLKPIWQPLWQLLPSWLTGLIIWTLKWFLGLATMLALVLYRNQNAMLYHPEIAGMVRDPAGNPPRLRNPSEWLIPYEDVTVETADKLKLHCWFLKQEDTANAPTLIFFQENAGNMGMRLPSMNEFYRRLGMNVFMVSYRGYGRSEVCRLCAWRSWGDQRERQRVRAFERNRDNVDRGKHTVVSHHAHTGSLSCLLTLDLSLACSLSRSRAHTRRERRRRKGCSSTRRQHWTRFGRDQMSIRPGSCCLDAHLEGLSACILPSRIPTRYIPCSILPSGMVYIRLGRHHAVPGIVLPHVSGRGDERALKGPRLALL